MLFVCEKWAREYRLIFSLKKCEIMEYGAVLTDKVKEWDLQDGKVLEGKVYKYLGILFHQSLSGKAHAVDFESAPYWAVKTRSQRDPPASYCQTGYTSLCRLGYRIRLTLLVSSSL
jgi:hypothetical protein